jgi:tetratricopeptide (TPR) repeat protein
MNIKQLLPHNYRIITATKNHIAQNKKMYSAYAFSFAILLFIFLLSCTVYLFFLYKTVQKERIITLQRLVFWEKNFTKYKDYPEVYYNAAVYAKWVGDTEKAREYAQKSLQLNPNFEPSTKLLQRL